MDLPLEDEGLGIKWGVLANSGDGGIRLLGAACRIEKPCAFQANQFLKLRIVCSHLLDVHVRIVVEFEFAKFLDELDVQFQLVGKLRCGQCASNVTKYEYPISYIFHHN